MSWFHRNNAVRAGELNTVAYMLWKRNSTDPSTQLQIRLENPEDKNSAFVVMRNGAASKPMRNRKEVQKYMRSYYRDLFYKSSIWSE